MLTPLDMPGFLAQPVNTESGTTAPLFANPGTTFATTPAITQASVLGNLWNWFGGGLPGTSSGNDGNSVPTFAQYIVLALLAVVLIGVGTVVLLKD